MFVRELLTKTSSFRESPLSKSMCEFFPVIFYAIIGASLFRKLPSNLFIIFQKFEVMIKLTFIKKKWVLMEKSQSLTALTINRAFVLFKLLDRVHVSKGKLTK